ncbi:hypothetical protein [Nakamurella leprariae]|uniref:Secreted protein n=1 Tax=Nakamurella leprariae TaxID=2803911 RepID=A0A939C1U5_9ACTN|nr:hypothetical protein [Nakamurella leprariae]MBM9467487.1 hypothetical protein [Nakamurella leprariae]
MSVEATNRRIARHWVTGAAALAVLTLGLTACGGSTPAASIAGTTSVITSMATVTSTAEAPDATVTETDVVSSTTAAPTTGSSADDGGGGQSTPTGGDDHSGSAPNPCPDDATLRSVTPDYDPQYPIDAITCSGDWAVGTYEADGRNQATGIWREVSGSWAYQDRATVCAQADDLPPELDARACSGS